MVQMVLVQVYGTLSNTADGPTVTSKHHDPGFGSDVLNYRIQDTIVVQGTNTGHEYTSTTRPRSATL